MPRSAGNTDMFEIKDSAGKNSQVGTRREPDFSFVDICTYLMPDMDGLERGP